MVEVITYLLIFIFFWGLFGLMAGLLSLLSKNERRLISIGLEKDSKTLIYGLGYATLLGPITLILMCRFKLEEYVRNYDYKDDV